MCECGECEECLRRRVASLTKKLEEVERDRDSWKERTKFNGQQTLRAEVRAERAEAALREAKLDAEILRDLAVAAAVQLDPGNKTRDNVRDVIESMRRREAMSPQDPPPVQGAETPATDVGPRVPPWKGDVWRYSNARHGVTEWTALGTKDGAGRPKMWSEYAQREGAFHPSDFTDGTLTFVRRGPTEPTREPAAPPVPEGRDPRAVPGSWWRDDGGEFELAWFNRGSHTWAVEPAGGSGLCTIDEADLETCEYVRGPGADYQPETGR